MIKDLFLTFLFVISFNQIGHTCLSKELGPFSVTQEWVDSVVTSSLLSSYDQINKNWTYAKSTELVKADAPSWKANSTSTNNNKEITFLAWDQETEPSLSKAVRDVLASTTRAECANASKISKIRIFDDLLGDGLFSDLVVQISKQSKSPFQFMHTLSWCFQTPCDLSFKGVYALPFINITEYSHFKPQGDAQNHNVFKLADGRFVGFDPVFFNVPRTYDELERHMYDVFISADHISDEKVALHKMFCSQLTFEKFQVTRRQDQSQIPAYRFDVDKIELFIQTGKLS